VTQERPVNGKRIVVTGGTNGIGLELARGLAARGAALTLLARNLEKGMATADELSREPGAVGVPDVVLGDLSDFASVRRAATEIRDRYPAIDVLVNNAGIHVLSSQRSPDGFDLMIATNFLGPFLFTNLLLMPLQAPRSARVVVTCSEAHRTAGRVDVATLGDHRKYGLPGAERVYGRSKLLDILFTQELARRLEGTGVTVNGFCPGLVDTGLVRESRLVMAGSAVLARARVVRRPEQGAKMGLRLVLDPAFDKTTGGFFTSTPGLRFLPTMPALKSASLQRQVWDKAAELVEL
jgi:NAD(P)-dependent dehydrogenase (short-subunit alcohol dehydrogenase family)